MDIHSRVYYIHFSNKFRRFQWSSQPWQINHHHRHRSPAKPVRFFSVSAAVTFAARSRPPCTTLSGGRESTPPSAAVTTTHTPPPRFAARGSPSLCSLRTTRFRSGAFPSSRRSSSVWSGGNNSFCRFFTEWNPLTWGTRGISSEKPCLHTKTGSEEAPTRYENGGRLWTKLLACLGGIFNLGKTMQCARAVFLNS